jgi:hypothetical protein
VTQTVQQRLYVGVALIWVTLRVTTSWASHACLCAFYSFIRFKDHTLTR